MAGECGVCSYLRYDAMPESVSPLSKYRTMWLLAMFDLPVDTSESKRNYTQFRKALLKEGFMMLQYSVYGRYCGGEEKTTALKRRVKVALPPDGEVRLLPVTDHQFGLMEVYEGKSRKTGEKQPEQLLLF